MSCKRMLIKGLYVIGLIIFAICPVFGEYAPMTPDMPQIKAILYKTGNPIAIVSLNGTDYHAFNGALFEDEWKVEEVRRKSVLFRKKSNYMFVEIFLNNKKNLRQTIDTSFLGRDIWLSDALELIAKVYNVNIMMHPACEKKVSISTQPRTLKSLLNAAVHGWCTAVIELPFVYVVPMNRKFSSYDLSRLEFYYPGLRESGWLESRGDDIKLVLRRLSNGTGIPFMFSEKLNFPVYASFRNVKFSVILEKLLYLNDCYLIEYEKGLEIAR
jgi:hypothetical protein